MNHLRANLAYLIQKWGTNPTALSQATGVPQPTIHRILKGESEDPRTNTLAPLANYFNCTIEFLRTADAESMDHAQREILRRMECGELDLGDTNSSPIMLPFRNVPVVGSVEAGPDGYLEEAGYPVGHGDGSVEHPAKGRNAYALRVRGESMHPRIRSGEFIVVEPDIPANPGDDVVVICCDGRKMVKQMLYQRDGELTLGSINNGFKPITLPLQEVEAIHYVAGILPRGAFKP